MQRRRMVSAGVVILIIAVAAGFWLLNDGSNDGVRGAGDASAIATLDAPDVHSLLVDPKDPDHIFFGSHAGIQESYDGGFSWEAGGLRNADAMQLVVSPHAPDTLYATGHDVLQVSRDGGKTWEPLSHDLPGTDVHGFAQDPTDPERLYAYIAGMDVFMSQDGGSTWTPLPTQPPGGGMHLTLAASETTLYAATKTGIVASNDEGATWEALPTEPDGVVISLAAPPSDPQVLYAGTDNGVARSADGGKTWTALGPTGVPVVALAVSPTDQTRVILVSDEAAVYRSDDGGATWLKPR